MFTHRQLINQFLEDSGIKSQNKLTFKYVKAMLNQFQIGIRKNSYGEYCVNYFGGKESTCNYDSDLESSYHVGLLMVIHKDKWNK